MVTEPPATTVRGAPICSAAKPANWDESPVHRVTISQGFLISETEVTAEQFRQFKPDAPLNGKYAPYAAGVSWDDAVAFCAWLGKKEGRHYRLARTLNSPQVLTRPHPPILIGGGGEKKTLRLVARYAQACNLFQGPDMLRKLDVLRAHCEAEGRSYDDIEKTVLFNFDLGERGEHVNATIDGLGKLAEQGFAVAHGGLRDAHRTDQFALFAERVIPAIADL